MAIFPNLSFVINEQDTFVNLSGWFRKYGSRGNRPLQKPYLFPHGMIGVDAEIDYNLMDLNKVGTPTLTVYLDAAVTKVRV